MPDFFFRTEDIRPDEVPEYFVESQQDRAVINALKGRNPTIVVGSRGVGKSFLLRVAQNELNGAFSEDRVFPIYMSFVRSSLLASNDPEQFKHWMLARACSAIIRSLEKAGLIASVPTRAMALVGAIASAPSRQFLLETIADEYENSWRSKSVAPNPSAIPSVDTLKNALEDL